MEQIGYTRAAGKNRPPGSPVPEAPLHPIPRIRPATPSHAGGPGRTLKPMAPAISDRTGWCDPPRYAVGADPTRADAGGIHYCCVAPSAATLEISSFSPGPIVVETLTRLTKAPLTPA